MSSDRLKTIDKVKGFFRSTRSRSRSRVASDATDSQVGVRVPSRTDNGVQSANASAPTTGFAPALNSTDLMTTRPNENRSHFQVAPPEISVPALEPLDPETAGSSESRASPAPDAPQEIDIWKLAYSQLTKREPGLVKHYEQILAEEESDEGNPSAEGQVTRPGITHSMTRLSALASTKLAKLDESRLKFRVRSKTFVIKDQVDRVLTIVIAAKDFISSAVASEPHGALAWAGVCILLPVSLSSEAP